MATHGQYVDVTRWLRESQDPPYHLKLLRLQRFLSAKKNPTLAPSQGDDFIGSAYRLLQDGFTIHGLRYPRALLLV